MNVPYFISRRLRLKGDAAEGTFTGVAIAVCGVALSLAVMMISIAVVTGFRHEIRNKVEGFDSQIVLYHGDRYITLTDTLQSIILDVAPGASVSVVEQRPGILKTPDSFVGLSFKGITAGYDTAFIASAIKEGVLPDLHTADDSDPAILISWHVASRLQLSAGDNINGYFFTDGTVKARRFRVSGIYDTHFGDFDRMNAFVAKPVLDGISLTAPDEGSRIEVSGLASSEISSVSEKLYESLIGTYSQGRISDMPLLTDVNSMGALYFNWLELLDANVIVILALMGAVAGFTLISSLFIIILRRVRLIGILKSQGATTGFISRIFIAVSMRIVFIGMVVGNLLTLALILLQDTFHIVPLDPEAYYLDYVPVELGFISWLALNVGVAVAGYIVVVLPSRIVATISPSETMRYE